MGLRHQNKSILIFTGTLFSLVSWLTFAKPNPHFRSFPTKSDYFLADSADEDTLDKIKYKPSRKPTYKEKEQYEDYLKNKERKRSPLTLDRPKGVKTEVELDPSGQYYNVNEKLGDVDFKPGTIMTFDQYKRFQNKQAAKNYYRQKSKESDDKAAAKKDKPRALIPRIYINPNLDRIFGGNYIDVKLNGSVLLDFGYRIQVTNNPAIAVNQRSIGGFFFDQQIAMNAQAKIGERLKITINQDTKSQFDFDNNVKIEYTALETDIIQKVEAGNVSMPLNTSLIQGAQNLFGVKATLKFGRLQVTAIAAQQRGRGQETKLQGGAQGRDFSVRADNYEDNRHYFLGQFFRNNYEKSLENMPQITSGVNVTRVEVWITNRNNTTDNLRNAVGFMDLGEYSPFNKTSIIPFRHVPTSNESNSLFNELIKVAGDSTNSFAGLRRADNTAFELEGASFGLKNGDDFEVMRNCRRLKDTEFKFNPQLGYISLNTAVGRDDIVSVAFEYSYLGKVYKVGELTEDYSKLDAKQTIFVKLLRPSTIRTDVPMWDLQMKNIYSLQASNISRENFQLRVVYRDDRTQLNTPVLKNEPKSLIDGKPLIQILGLDRLNMSNDPQPDGNFDFVESSLANPIQPNLTPGQNANQTGATNTNDPTQNQNGQTNTTQSFLNQNRITAITIDPAAGRVIFPVLEPFGKTLKQGFQEDSLNRPELINKYVYNELYRRTKADALQLSNKNKFFIIGRYQATASDEIPISGFAGGGIADSKFVKVTSGGLLLTENVQYIVQPNGTVKIIDPSLLLPGKDISVRYEQADLFQVRSKFFTGARLDYVLNKDVAFGATLLNLNERPLISRVAIGDEPVNNTVWGFDGTYKSDSRLITNILDKLPFYSTKEKSTVQISGEFAQLIPGAPQLVTKDGQPTFFIDDFESTQLPFRLDNTPWLNWRLAATPPNFEGAEYPSNPLALGYKRAKIAWYAVDQSFYRGDNANNQNANDLKNNYIRPVLPQAIFPGRDRTQLQLNEPIFDIAYFPSERGTYNYNPNLSSEGNLPNPENNWGGITRAVNNYDTDFDNANYQYLEFWMMDPFLGGNNGKILDGKLNKNNETGGKVFFNLGSISEDVLKDGKQSFEQGLPTNGQKPGPEVDASPWGYVTNQPFITNAFQNDPGARANQDVGLDGLKDDEEKSRFKTYVDEVSRRVTNEEERNKIINDPSNDNFQYFLGSQQDESGKKILERYKAFNGSDGNSPDNSSNSSGFNASSYSTPDNEDINQNNTLNDLEEFFQYELDLKPGGLAVGKNFIVNSVDEVVPENGETITWYLVRIPLREGFTKFGNIQNFKSVRFLRTYLTGWKEPVVLRMAQLQLVGSQWRPFTGDLSNKGLKEVIEPNDQVFTISTVNTEENSQGSPTNPNVSPYVVPPGYQRDNDVNSITPRRLNEHSLRLCVDQLPDEDARAVFKNMGGLSLINYNKVKMFVHAEGDPNAIKDNDLTVFMRFGSDFTDNYYEIEMPLKLTNNTGGTTYDPNEIWKQDNWFDIDLNELWNLKLQRDVETGDLFSVYPAFMKTNTRRLYIRGNPSYTNLQTVMIGVRNPKSIDKQPKSVCIWVNELRVEGIKQSDGFAATARASIKLADLGNVSATTKYTGAGFGGLEQKISQRLQENTLEIGVNANIQVEKLIPKNEKIGLRLPMYASYDNKNISPKYDPTNPDVPTERSVANKELINPGSGADYATLIQDNTTRRSISFNNISKVKTKPNAKKYIFDIENISLSVGYSDVRRSNVNIQNYDSKNYKAGAGYNFAPKAIVFEPFKKMKGIMASDYLKLIKDLNISPLPSSISVRGDLDRIITQTQYSNGIVNGRHDTIGIPATFEKRFLFNRNYAVGWGITKSIQFNYNASVNAIVDEPPGGFEGYADKQMKTDSILKNLQNGGRIKNFNQKVGLNYKLPLDKFPATNWLAADARYSASYTYTAGPYRNPDKVNLGNTVQNSRDINLNGRADLVKFYNKIKFLSTINSDKPKPAPPKLPPGQKDTSKVKPPPDLAGLKGVLRFLMLVRSVNITYQRTNGTILPGYLGTPKYFGLDESLNGGNLNESFLPFILGDQSSSVYKNENFANTYFSRNPLITERITQNQSENITGRANLEPFKDFRIQLDAKITNTVSYQERFAPQFDTINGDAVFSQFASQNPYRTGTYSISYLTVESFFEENLGKSRTSAAFSQFENNRQTIVDRLNKENPNVNAAKYDTSSQDALIPAFLSAYSNTPASKIGLTSFPAIPLPNWRIDYAGLPNLFPAIKEIFPSISITHAYSNTYSVSSYSSSLRYGGDTIGINKFYSPSLPTQADSAGIFVPINIINQVSIVERFAPLLGFNFKTKGNMNFRIEYTADRLLNFTLQNRQITETRNEGFTIGYGYTKANLKLPIKWQGREVVLKNDVTFRVDLSRKESTTIQRRIDGPAVITQGQINFNIRPNIAYQVNQRLTTQFYFEYTLVQPKISTSFTRTVFAFGIQIRYSLS
ncbi:MAG: cell surface protein SprA [Cytophagales bacterium]